MRYLLLTLISLLMAMPAANGQKNAALSILIETLNESARRCGVTEDTLRTPAVLTLRNNRIDVAKTSTLDPVLYINVNVNFNEQSRFCSYNISISIFVSDTAKTRGRFRAASGIEQVNLCSNKGTMGGVGQAAAGRTIVNDVEQFIKDCLAEVAY